MGDSADLADLLKRFRSDQGGQSLIIVTVMMTVVMAISAFSVDVAGWYVQRHHAQVVADSAALAAANCLAHPGSEAGTIDGTISVPACSSGTDSTDATTVADDYATANGIQNVSQNVSVNVNTSSDNVSVTVQSPASSFFARLFGINSTTPSANSKAGWSAGATTTCSTGTGAQCAAVYAGNTACPTTSSPSSSQSPQPGFQDGNTGAGATPTVNGTVHSEGGITIVNSGPSFNGSPPLTVAGSCYNSSDMPDYGKATSVASQSWPINYAASPYFTACTNNCITVSGIANVPPYCTQATTSTTGFNFTNVNNNPELPVSGNVYCSIGTGTASNPTTWNGPIQIQANDPASGCGSTYPDVTFIGGNVSFITNNGGGTSICLSPDLYNCLIYSTGAVNIYNGTFNWTGNIFDPTGTVTLGSQSAGGDSDTSSSGMIEAWNVYMINATLNLTGDGPQSSSSSSGASGSDTLLQ